MRPIPIPAAAVWPNAKRIVMSAPNGDLMDDTIRPVEAIDEMSSELGVRILTVMCALDPGDLEKLAAGGTVAISFYGAMVPFEVNVCERVEGQEP
jgi:hypothetical protein